MRFSNLGFLMLLSNEENSRVYIFLKRLSLYNAFLNFSIFSYIAVTILLIVKALAFIVILKTPNSTTKGAKNYVDNQVGEGRLVKCQRYLVSLVKYIPCKKILTPFYLIINHSHLNGSKYFSRCLNMGFELV